MQKYYQVIIMSGYQGKITYEYIQKVIINATYY